MAEIEINEHESRPPTPMPTTSHYLITNRQVRAGSGGNKQEHEEEQWFLHKQQIDFVICDRMNTGQ